jgi:hypothetical protein
MHALIKAAGAFTSIMLGVSAAVNAAVPAQGSAPAVQRGAAADPNKKICESYKVVGSRLAVKRICATAAEWVERRQQDRDDATRIQSSITGSTCMAPKKNGIAEC